MSLLLLFQGSADEPEPPPAVTGGRPFNPHNATQYIAFPTPITDDDAEAFAVLLLL